MSNAPTGFSDSLAVTGFIGKYGTNTDLTKVKILILMAGT